MTRGELIGKLFEFLRQNGWKDTTPNADELKEIAGEDMVIPCEDGRVIIGYRIK
jgi:hypothetical protein